MPQALSLQHAPSMRLASLLCACILAAGCQTTMRTRTSPTHPMIEEEGSCDSAAVRPGDTCTERSVPAHVPAAAIATAILIAVAVAVAAGPYLLDDCAQLCRE